MGMGLEIYDEKGRLIIGEDTIIRWSGEFHVDKPNERTEYSISGNTLNYRVDYNIYRWENNGSGGGQTQANDSFSSHVVVWVV